MHAHAMKVNFILVTTKGCAKESTLSLCESSLKNKSLKYKKVKTKRLQTRFGWKNAKIIVLKKCVIAPEM